MSPLNKGQELRLITGINESFHTKAVKKTAEKTFSVFRFSSIQTNILTFIPDWEVKVVKNIQLSLKKKSK